LEKVFFHYPFLQNDKENMQNKLTNKRKNEKKGTIITTNLDEKSFVEKFGSAIYSRVSSGKGFVLEGENKRIKTQID